MAESGGTTQPVYHNGYYYILSTEYHGDERLELYLPCKKN